MKIAEKWLKQYIRFTDTPEALAGKLTMLGIEVASIERLGEKYEGFVVAHVLDVRKHPNADKLTVCSVDVGTKTVQVVCGAPNVAVGQKVAVGLSGAVVPKNQHDPEGKPFTLSNVKIRGVESFGMICSEYELDLGKDAGGILVLRPDARVGQPLSTYLGLDDVVYDTDITPNRPDLLSYIGLAREIGVLTGKAPMLPAVRLKEGKEPIRRHLTIRVEDTVNCTRFAARLIRNVKIGPSPEWLQTALKNAGLRPRNNVVDVTNYVMLEIGHPLHAFDYALLRKKTIVVRQASPDLSFTTLDGKVHRLPPAAVMVCDGEGEVSIAGIMGGANSEISDNTQDVVIESAHWNPSSIRRTGKALGISSDASQRFERGADPNAVIPALDRAAQLVLETAGGTLLKGVIDIYPKKVRERIVPVRRTRTNAVLGTSLTKNDIAGCLKPLGLALVRSEGDKSSFRVPTYRVDLEREIDLIEEVARVYGYDNIEDKTVSRVDFAHPFKTHTLVGRVRDVLIGFGYQEAITNSMQDIKRVSFPGVKPVRLLNPLGKEMAYMRTTLVPGLLDTVARNQNYGNLNLRLFEVGRVFCEDGSEKPTFVEHIVEDERLCLMLTGDALPRHWGGTPRPADLFDLKGEVASVLDRLALDKWNFIYYRTTNTLAEYPVGIEINGSYAGYLGKVAHEVLKDFDIGQDVYFAELTLARFEQDQKRDYKPLPKFPRVRRDVAFVVDESISAERLERSIKDSSTELLHDVELFDVYQGEKLPQGKKSLAFSLGMLSPEKTLTEAEIDAEAKRIVDGVSKALGATLRTF